VIEFLTLGELTVALLMGLGALCAFVWAAASGALGEEDTKQQVLRAEAEDDDGDAR
jgi:hypothetical protein